MNNSTIAVTIVHPPELRHTNNQTPIAEFQVSFPVPKQEQPAVVKAIAWGKLGENIAQQDLQVGDRLILESRISMVTEEALEGYKVKKAILNVQRYFLVEGAIVSPTQSETVAPSIPQPQKTPVTPVAQLAQPKAKPAPAAVSEPSYDDIPF